MENHVVDVCIIGGGSSGIGAAYGFLQSNKNVLLIEKELTLGGTPVYANVNRWERGPDAPFCKELFNQLKSEGNALIERGEIDYNETLKNSGPGVIFNKEAYAITIETVLADGGIDVMTNCCFEDAIHDGTRVVKIYARLGTQRIEIEAKLFIDATVRALLCTSINNEEIRNLGQAGYFLGADAKGTFGEENAPTQHTYELNAIDYCFEIIEGNVRPCTERTDNPWGMSYNEPNCFIAGKPVKIVNPCGMLTLDGMSYYNGHYSAECIQGVASDYMEWLRGYEPQEGIKSAFADYRIINFPKWVGVRESRRVSCQRMLTQNDITQDITTATNKNEFIAVSTHSVDIHGKNSIVQDDKLTVSESGYGIPYGTIVPIGLDNVYVVSMSAGFSHIAAASARLTRTLMQLGYAAAKASIIILNKGLKKTSVVDLVQLQKDIKLCK